MAEAQHGMYELARLGMDGARQESGVGTAWYVLISLYTSMPFVRLPVLLCLCWMCRGCCESGKKKKLC
jgi:hypothetical protein